MQRIIETLVVRIIVPAAQTEAPSLTGQPAKRHGLRFTILSNLYNVDERRSSNLETLAVFRACYCCKHDVVVDLSEDTMSGWEEEAEWIDLSEDTMSGWEEEAEWIDGR